MILDIDSPLKEKARSLCSIEIATRSRNEGNESLHGSFEQDE